MHLIPYRGQAAADEAAATPPPMQVQTERASTTNLATVIPSAPRMAISLPLTCDVSPPHTQVGVAPIAEKSFSTGGHACQWTLHFGSYNDRTTVFNQLKACSIPGTQPHDGCLPLYG